MNISQPHQPRAFSFLLFNTPAILLADVGPNLAVFAPGLPALRCRWHDAVIAQGFYDSAIAAADRAGIFIEEQGHAEAFSHFGHAQDRMSADGQVDAGERGFAFADAIEPIFFQARETGHGCGIAEGFGIDFVGEDAFWLKIDFVLSRGEVNGGFAPANHVGNALLVHGAAGDHDGITTREFGEHEGRVWNFAIGGNFPGAGAGDAVRVFGISSSEHKREEFVREKIPQNARIIRIEFVPAKIMLRSERNLGRFAEPAFPIEISFIHSRIDGISPFAVFGIVPAIGALTPNQGAELPFFDPGGGFVIHGIGAKLRPELERFFRFRDGIVNLEAFFEIAREGLFPINMFARLHGIDGHLGVPIVHRSDNDGIDILAFEKFSVIAVGVGVFEAYIRLGRFEPLVINITNGRLDNIVFGGVIFLAADMGHPLAAHTDISNSDAVVRSGDICRRRLVLAVNRTPEEPGGSSGRRGTGSLADEFSA
jgi:hypothetical protein